MIGQISCAVLVGGNSIRFGRDKALVVMEGETLVERIVNQLAEVSDDVMVVGNRLERFGSLRARLLRDRIDGMGAVGGTYTALRSARHPYVFVAACDMPFLNAALIRYMSSLVQGYDAVVPYIDDMAEPMHAIYGKTALPAIKRLIATGDRCMLNFLPDLTLRAVAKDEIEQIDPQFRSFCNLNTPQDWAEVQALFPNHEIALAETEPHID